MIIVTRILVLASLLSLIISSELAYSVKANSIGFLKFPKLILIEETTENAEPALLIDNNGINEYDIEYDKMSIPTTNKLNKRLDYRYGRSGLDSPEQIKKRFAYRIGF
jgi:hypothetical protein